MQRARQDMLALLRFVENCTSASPAPAFAAPVSNRRPRSACWIAWPGPPTRSGRFAPYPRRRVPAMTGKCSNRRQSALLRVAGRPRTRTALVRTALGSRPLRSRSKPIVGTTNRFHRSINTDRVFGTHNDRLQAAFHRYAGSSQATCRILRLQSRLSWTDAWWLLQDPPRLSRQALLVSSVMKFVHLITQCEC
jgi:hypothetical protein